jgi:uncharacterized protein YdhG (YjbR/CyaY superfamily)
MARTDFTSVDEYIAAQPDASQPVLARVRAAIRRALPEADEVISYQIPAYKVQGVAAIYFAGWKEHWSLYPVGTALVAAFREELAGGVATVQKATLRFPLARPVPAKLVARIAQYRGREAEADAQARAARRQARR